MPLIQTKHGNFITCPLKLAILQSFMMFEFGATVGYGISKEITSKEIALFNLFWSISGKFKHHKKSENVNFEETNNAVSILAYVHFM